MELKKLQEMLDSDGKRVKVLHVEEIETDLYWIVYTANLGYKPVIPYAERKTLTEDEEDILAVDYEEAIMSIEEKIKED